MKELLIVNNNMKVGGVQKSLYNLLWSLDPTEYRVTLLLFSKIGEYVDSLPDTVRVVEVTGPFRLLGKSQKEYTGMDALKRGVLALASRMVGRDAVIRCIRKWQPMLTGQYDCAISFMNNTTRANFYGGAQDYVLHCVEAARKVVFLHSDYQKSGANYPENNRLMEQFDTIAACSEGCRRCFVEVMPHLADRCVAVPNCHRYDEIRTLADQEAVSYNENEIHAVTVSRLTPTKGLERAIRAVERARSTGLPVTLHIVGDGPARESLQALTQELGLSDAVSFHGQLLNPYPYIKHADFLLLPSYHEAAPMVIDEARCLGVPILSTETTSTQEMVVQAQAGWVCANDQEALTAMLCRVASDRQGLDEVRAHLSDRQADNRVALERFAAVVNG